MIANTKDSEITSHRQTLDNPFKAFYRGDKQQVQSAISIKTEEINVL